MIEVKRGEYSYTEGLIKARERLLPHLLDIGAIRFGDFRLKLHDQNPEAPLSPVYIDLRVLQRLPKVKVQALDVYQELIQPLHFDLLAGVPLAATALVSSLSDRLGIGMITPRIEEKGYGSGVKVDGLLESDRGKTAVLIDDVVTTADSKLKAANVLTDNGIVVRDIVVLIDREQGGREQLEDVGFHLHCAFTMKEILDFSVRIGKIDDGVYEDVKRRLELLNNFLGF